MAVTSGAPTTLAGGFSAGEAALRRSRGTEPDVTASQRKLATDIENVTKKLKEQAATFGENADKIELYRLKLEGATTSELAQVAALQKHVDLMKLASGPMPKPQTGPGGLLGGVSGAEAEDLAAHLSEVFAVGATLPPVFGDIGTSLDENVTKKVQAATEALQNQIDVVGESKPEILLGNLNQMGATPEQIASVAALVAQLKDLQDETGKGYREMESARKEADQEAMAIGNLSAAWKGFVDSLKGSSADLRTTFFDTLKRGFDSAEDSMARFIVTGRGSMFQVLQQLEMELVKLGMQFVLTGALTGKFQGFGGLIGGALGGGGAAGKTSDPAVIANTAATTANTTATTGHTSVLLAHLQVMVSHIGVMFAHLGVMFSHLAIMTAHLAVMLAHLIATEVLTLVESVKSFLFGLAGGGEASAGIPHIVGENGPELFVPSITGMVLPNSHPLTASALGALTNRGSAGNPGGAAAGGALSALERALSQQRPIPGREWR